MPKTMRGMMVGRFQPFHKGHLAAVHHILSEVEELVLIIAAAEQAFKAKNPFTAGERYEMIHQTLIDELGKNRTKVLIVTAPDINDYSLWPFHLKRLSPSFEIVYTHNHITKLLFNNHEIAVKTLPTFHHEKWNGTNIRKLMSQKNAKWKKLVPKAVKDFLEKEIEGELRLITINKKNSDNQ
jgi:nicotinamide-nucleotide adenylyltransferase